MGHEGRIDERRVHPKKGSGIVGDICRAGSKGSRLVRQPPYDAGVAPVQPARSVERLVECAECHGVHGGEGAVKAAEGIGNGI